MICTSLSKIQRDISVELCSLPFVLLELSSLGKNWEACIFWLQQFLRLSLGTHGEKVNLSQKL